MAPLRRAAALAPDADGGDRVLTPALLAIEGVNAYYGRAQALEDVSFEIAAGACHALGGGGVEGAEEDEASHPAALRRPQQAQVHHALRAVADAVRAPHYPMPLPVIASCS